MGKNTTHSSVKFYNKRCFVYYSQQNNISTKITIGPVSRMALSSRFATVVTVTHVHPRTVFIGYQPFVTVIVVIIDHYHYLRHHHHHHHGHVLCQYKIISSITLSTLSIVIIMPFASCPS